MYVWWMLRDMVSESALKQAVAAYRSEADKPDYMQHLIEAQAKSDLQMVFRRLGVSRSRACPIFRVASVYPREMLGNNYVVTVTVENRGGAGAEVPVTLTMEEGQVTKRLEVRRSRRQPSASRQPHSAGNCRERWERAGKRYQQPCVQD